MGDVPSQRTTKWYIPPPRSEDSLQFFKESHVDGAVYNLYLKKIRYHTPSDEFDEQDGGRETLLQWRTVEISVIKSGTLERIIEALCMEDGELDSTNVNVFLATYRPFASPQKVIDLLMDRYQRVGDDGKMKQHVKESHRRSIKSFLSVWIDTYPEDFRDPPTFPCLKQLISLAERHMPGSDIVTRATHKMERFKKDEESSASISVDDLGVDFNPMKDVKFPPHSPSGLTLPLDFETIPVQVFAEQLTFMDAMLFKKVVPHHCLGAVWSRGDKKRLQAPSVYATINQFNAVSYRVIATVLKHPDLGNLERAKILERWIGIAQELRMLKNFSSLKAIISGLQSNPVYRLRRVWDEVNRECMQDYSELAALFSEENNQILVRELLMKEGTAKFADLENNTSTLKSQASGRRQSLIHAMMGMTLSKPRKSTASLHQMMQGTVPYLGTFLTDLTMIDTAIPDFNDENFINFEKKRKEFESLAQIKLLQSAASMYMIKPDPVFWEWFHNIRVYDDNESYELSCEIELVTPSTPKEVRGHRKKSSLGFFSPRRPADSVEDLTSSSPSIYLDESSGMDSVSESPESFLPSSKLRHSVSVCSLSSMDSLDSPSSWRSSESCVVKVSMEVTECHYTNNYKSILLSNADHTKDVIKNILSKFSIEGKPDEYAVFQILPSNDELQIPDKGNVFYALNSSVPEFQFVVRKKSDLERIKAKHKRKKDRKVKLTL